MVDVAKTLQYSTHSEGAEPEGVSQVRQTSLAASERKSVVLKTQDIFGKHSPRSR